ncbi:MAG: ferredoxin-type protein NapH [Crocinitomix sp.]|jgi:ferredoxin-type protein NapH
MKNLKYTGMVIFLIGLAIFTTTPFLGNVKMTEAVMFETLNEQELANLENPLREQLVDKEFSTTFGFSQAFIGIYNAKNKELKANEDWGNVMWTKPGTVALTVSRVANDGLVTQNKWLFFFLTFGLGIIGALFYIIVDLKLKGPPGIKNDGIYHDTATNRGWIGILTAVWLVTFYIVLYFHPYIMTDAISLTDPVKGLFKEGAMASQWFLYGLLYCTSMLVMGVRMYIKYRHNKYQIVRTTSVLFFQVIFAFLLVEILPLFGLPGRDLKNAMPLDYTFLYKYNIEELLEAGQFGTFLIVWGFVLSIIVVPTLVYFYGKRWYCSWVCGCGGLAETLGDPYRQLSNKKMWAWKLERWLIHGVLVFAAILTVFVGVHTFTSLNGVNEGEGVSTIMGISAFDVRDWYGFMVGAVFAGVIGTGFYPLFGNRTWCRFGCPLAAYMGLVQRFKSRFRITTNGGQCISCGNCSTYCEQGIDVRAYAQKGQNIIRSSCVGCGVCAAVCPRGVLKLENGPEAGRFGNEGPIVLGNDGFEINN